jgi:hypothetical protein
MRKKEKGRTRLLQVSIHCFGHPGEVKDTDNQDKILILSTEGPAVSLTMTTCSPSLQLSF